MKIKIAQMNPTVGDIQGNFSKIEQGLLQAKKDMAGQIVLPELFITCYPPKDFLERRWFLDQIQNALDDTVSLYKRNRGDRYSPWNSCKG